MDKPVFIGLKPIPLSQDIERGHREGQTSLEVRPDPMADFLEVADGGQHRQHRLDDHPYVPSSPGAQLQVGRVSPACMEVGVGQHDHPVLELFDEWMERRVVHIGRVTVPLDDETPLIEDQTELPADNPPIVRFALFADLLVAPSFSDGMEQFDAIGVGHPQDGRVDQEPIRPVVMRLEQAE